ncbi:MAG: DnaJ family domain-containing protein [Thermodesulfobacteriota bacterium]|nr:DnaJ family domain-containing protein [Thermodesulfobacteriota bacterium]
MFNFTKIAENRIREAIKRGELDDIPGKGKPLVFEDDSFVPQDLRMAYKMLKNAGFVPPQLQSEKEIKTAMDLLQTMDDEEERYRQIKKINLMVSKANISRKRPINLEKDQIYYRKVVERIKVRKKK